MLRRGMLLALLAAVGVVAAAWTVQAKDWAAYSCNSRFRAWSWTLPRIDFLHFYHTSVALCPDGESPEMEDEDGTSVSNPSCDWYGTHPGSDRFEEEPERFGVSCRPVDAPASLVQQRMQDYRQNWTLFRHNCHEAADEVIRPPDDEDNSLPDADEDE